MPSRNDSNNNYDTQDVHHQTNSWRVDNERIATAKILQELHLCKPISDENENNTLKSERDPQEIDKDQKHASKSFPPFKKRCFSSSKVEDEKYSPLSSKLICQNIQENRTSFQSPLSINSFPSPILMTPKNVVYTNSYHSSQILPILSNSHFNLGSCFQKDPFSCDNVLYPPLVNKQFPNFDPNKHVNMGKTEQQLLPLVQSSDMRKNEDIKTSKMMIPQTFSEADKKMNLAKKCRMDSCNKPAAKRTPYCTFHRGVRRCEHEGCSKCAQGRTRFCIAHGGGRRCMHPSGCTKAARDKRFCAAHGGGKRCSEAGCNRLALVTGSNSELKCTAHGGGKRCHMEGCSKSAQSGTEFCVRHGGGKRCLVQGCIKVARGKTMLCMAHRRNFSSSVGSSNETNSWQTNILFCRPVLVGTHDRIEVNYQESN